MEKNYLELLKCNLNGVYEFDEQEINREFEIYENSIKDWSNYSGVLELKDWKHPIFEYPNIHPIHKKIVDTINSLGVKNVCDIGAGAGSVAKYVYASNNNVALTCVEGYDVHISQMTENFKENSDIIKPSIKVNANILKGTAQKIPLKKDSQDLVYTCTVMMHIPFLLAIKAAEEISRVTKKYVLHLERKDGNVVIGNQKSSLNYLHIDYKNLYEKLGFRTVEYYEFPYPEAEMFNCVYYLGEK